MIQSRIDYYDMPDFVGDITNILIENNFCENREVVSEEELEELSQTYDSVGSFLDDLENLYIRVLFDKFRDFLQVTFDKKVEVDYFVNCKDSHLTMQTPNKDIEFYSKDDYEMVCEIMNVLKLTEKQLTDFDKDYPKAIKALEILAQSGNDDNILDIFAWLQKSYEENNELFEPQNPYADLIAVNGFNSYKTQASLAIDKLRIFIANSVKSEYKTTDDAGILSEEVLECLEDESTQGKFLKGYCVDRDTMTFLDQINIINDEYLDLQEVKTNSTTKVPLQDTRRQK